MLEALPDGWRKVRLGHVVDTHVPQRDKPDPLTGPIPWIRIEDFDGQEICASKSGQGVTAEQVKSMGLRVYEPGTVLCSCSCSMGATAIVREPLVSNQTFIGLTPREGIESRYLFYLMQAMREELQSKATGAIQQYLSRDDFRAFRIPVPPIEEQRSIADFLDGETSRMTVLANSLRHFERIVQERERSVLAKSLNAGVSTTIDTLPNGWQWTPLMHLVDQLRQIMYGIVLPGPDVPEGVPIIKGGDVAANRLSLNTLSRTAHEIESRYARSRLKGGDLVIAIRGSVGEIAVVPDELTGANLTQDAARISAGPSVHPSWLRLALESPVVTHQIQRRVTGATIKGINIWDLKRVQVPTPPLAKQVRLAKSVEQHLEKHEALRSRVTRHRELLTERRQALITAAVTGQFDVSTASGRGITEGVTA